MTILVKLFAYFRDDRFIKEYRDYPEGTQVVEIVDELNIDHDEIGVLMINSRHTTLETQLKEDDILAIFPVVGGG